MTALHITRIALAVLLLIWGAVSLCRALGARETPIMRHARLLGSLCPVMLGITLLAWRAWHLIPALICGLGAAGCGAAAAAIIYLNSLHNTTM